MIQQEILLRLLLRRISENRDSEILSFPRIAGSFTRGQVTFRYHITMKLGAPMMNVEILSRKYDLRLQTTDLRFLIVLSCYIVI